MNYFEENPFELYELLAKENPYFSHIIISNVEPDIDKIIAYCDRETGEWGFTNDLAEKNPEKFIIQYKIPAKYTPMNFDDLYKIFPKEEVFLMYL